MKLGLGLGLNVVHSSGGPSVSAPTNTVLPVISGDAISGKTLSVTNGTWDDGGAAISGYTYQWKDDGVAISGATANTFLLTDTQIGGVITCTVTATNSAGSTDATSGGTAAVVAALSISGTPVLTATEGAAYAGFTATASGGETPYTYSLVGTWPAGITVNSSSGAVSGTPTESGSFTGLSVRVTDNNSDTADLDTFSVEVQATDQHFANVALLCGFDGVDAATTSIDESPAGHTLSFSGNAQLDTAQFKFGTASLLCDGTTDLVTSADSPDWDLSDANGDPFTIEAWIRRTTLATVDRTIVAQTGAGQGAFALRLASGANTTELTFNISNTGSSNDVSITTSGAGISINNWHHVAADKDSSGKVRVYANGVMVGSATPADSTMHNSTAALSIGADSGGGRSWQGWIDEVRITKGVARYASDSGYTVPTAAFPRS
jgi:hypothetical protein